MSQEQQRTLMAVHAHPDDECFMTGGVFARYSRAGARTVLVTCTRGEVGEISDPALATPENLAEVRAGELAESARILGISRVVQLGYRDSGMAGTADNQDPRSFHQTDLEEATGRLVAVVREERPEVMVTYDENGGYGHPDHVKAHQVAVAAFHAAGDPRRFPEAGPPWTPSKLYYGLFPRSSVEWLAQTLREAGIESPFSQPAEGEGALNPRPSVGAPEERVTTEIDVAAYAGAKLGSLLAHRTQTGSGVGNFFMRLPVSTVRDLLSREFFQRVAGPGVAQPDGRERDLFCEVRGG